VYGAGKGKLQKTDLFTSGYNKRVQFVLRFSKVSLPQPVERNSNQSKKNFYFTRKAFEIEVNIFKNKIPCQRQPSYRKEKDNTTNYQLYVFYKGD
jgi:hypothetical protein